MKFEACGVLLNYRLEAKDSHWYEHQIPIEGEFTEYPLLSGIVVAKGRLQLDSRENPQTLRAWFVVFNVSEIIYSLVTKTFCTTLEK